MRDRKRLSVRSDVYYYARSREKLNFMKQKRKKEQRKQKRKKREKDNAYIDL